ncbi:uncharacterized protein [Rutidosis leptorrhynchoides]|uniref:uncharacterized protein n=1 Tax=Rutidosis leptorrhynchoides TaxID=125765 RepID=UPI003A9A3007
MSNLISSEKWKLLNMVLWITWKNRNEAWNNSSCSIPLSAFMVVKRMLLEWTSTLNREQVTLCPRNSGWTPPEIGHIKINSDAAVFSNSFCRGLGLVFRDSSGHVILCQATIEASSPDIAYAEAAAILAGAQLAISMGYTNVIFESDAMIVIQNINSVGICFLSCKEIIFRIKALVSAFDSYSFIFLPRATNRLAHSLTNLGCNWQGRLPSSSENVASHNLR